MPFLQIRTYTHTRTLLPKMPVSKRARVVHESKVTKKSHKEQTRRLFANIQTAVTQYDHLFLFSVDNMRNTYLKDVRSEFADSRYVYLSSHPKRLFSLLSPFPLFVKNIIHACGRSLLTSHQPLLRKNKSNGRRPR